MCLSLLPSVSLAVLHNVLQILAPCISQLNRCDLDNGLNAHHNNDRLVFIVVTVTAVIFQVNGKWISPQSAVGLCLGQYLWNVAWCVSYEQWMLWGWLWSKWKVDKEEERWLIDFLSCNVGLGFVKQGFCTCMRQSERDSDEPLVMGELSLQINGSRITDCQAPVLRLCLCMFVSNCVPFTIVSILVEPSCFCAQDHILLCQTPLPSRQPFLLTFSLPAATHHAGLTHSRVLIIYWFTARVRTCVIILVDLSQNYSCNTKCCEGGKGGKSKLKSGHKGHMRHKMHI